MNGQHDVYGQYIDYLERIDYYDFKDAVMANTLIEKVRGTLKDPSKVIQSKSSTNACLFYSVEIEVSETESLFFCVVAVVTGSGRGRMVTAYDADFMKTGTELYSKK